MQQENNSSPYSSNYDNSTTMKDKNQPIVFTLSENQAANENASSDFVDRYQNRNLRVEKNAELLRIGIAIQDAFRLDNYRTKIQKFF